MAACIRSPLEQCYISRTGTYLHSPSMFCAGARLLQVACNNACRRQLLVAACYRGTMHVAQHCCVYTTSPHHCYITLLAHSLSVAKALGCTTVRTVQCASTAALNMDSHSSTNSRASMQMGRFGSDPGAGVALA
jgi:hypothetical protein